MTTKVRITLGEYERRSALRALRSRNRVPPADKELAMGPVWKKETIRSWLL